MHGDTQAAAVGLVLVILMVIGGVVGRRREARQESKARHPPNFHLR